MWVSGNRLILLFWYEDMLRERSGRNMVRGKISTYPGIYFTFFSASVSIICRKNTGPRRTQHWVLFCLHRGVCLCVYKREWVSTSTLSSPQTRLTGQIAIYLQSAGSAHSASLISRGGSLPANPWKEDGENWKVFLFWCAAVSSCCTSSTMSSWLTVRFCPLLSCLLPTAAVLNRANRDEN